MKAVVGMLYGWRIDGQDGFPDWLSIELIYSGCMRGLSGNPCEGCHNPELWDFSSRDDGSESLGSFIRRMEEFSVKGRVPINGLVVIGGEPLDQDLSALKDDILTVKSRFPDMKVLVYTGYDKEALQGRISTDGDLGALLEVVDYMKTGPYDSRCLKRKGSRLASGNQQVWAVSGRSLTEEVPF